MNGGPSGQSATQPSTPNMQNRPPPGFPLPNNVSNNLHIPPSKQRNLAQQTNVGSPMRPPMQMPAVNNPAQQPSIAAIQRMLNQAAPVNPSGGPGGIRPPMSAFPQQINGKDIKPYMLLQHMQYQQGQMEEGRPPLPQLANQVPLASELFPQLDRSGSLLDRVTWTPSAEHDAALRRKLTHGADVIESMSRASPLGKGPGASGILGQVDPTRMPEAIRAMAEEVESGETSGAEGGKGGKGKKDEGSGMPGQKKRRVQDLAHTIDKALVINTDVETVSGAHGSCRRCKS